MNTKDLPTEIFTAVHTACSELPDAHEDDVADAVFGMIGAAQFDAHSSAIMDMIGRLL